ncbi:hypothetical protein INT47_009821, partial [Mucor saturninus]
VDLRAELSDRNLSTKGKKDELIERLQAALEKPDQETTEEVQTIVPAVEESQPVLETSETPLAEVIAQQEDTSVVQKTETVVSNVTESIVQENSALPVIESTPIEEKVEEETQSPIAEKIESTVEKTETLIELPAASATPVPQTATVEAPVAQTTITEAHVPQTATVEAPVAQATTVETPNAKAPVVEAKSVTESPKKTMDADKNAKRRRSIEPDNTQEKRTKVSFDSSALYVKGFVRPLIIRSVQELFGSYGTVKRFWMDSIKTHCYVTYETAEEAKAAYDQVNGIVFPKDTGKVLSVGGLSPEQVDELIEFEQSAAERRIRVDWEATVEKVKSGQSLPASSTNENARKPRSIGIGQIAKQLAQAAEPVVAPSRQVEIVRPPKERTLEDLFCKTKTLPHLYYLPVSEEEAKAKLSQIQSL